MRSALLIFFGAGFGGVLRHYINLWCGRALGAGFPWGILIINVSGSILMGLAAGWFAFRGGSGLSQSARLFLTTGVLGGYTTFSTFSLDAALLIERGAYCAAAAYVAGSVGLALVGLFAGLAIMRAVL
jgi:fluoride exporter